MEDMAHDASGSASPKPGDIALQQASRPYSPGRGKLRVFISYSRDDLEFADQLDAALNAYGFECVIDRHGISGGEDWKRRLGNLISEADTVVFVLTPTSARSEICTWEAQESERLGKRILPVIQRSLEGASPPPRLRERIYLFFGKRILPVIQRSLEGASPPPQLRERNYIFFYNDPKAAPGAGFGTGLAKLIAALNTDVDWLREHTRYLQRATEWDRGGRPANRLLSGGDIADAKDWAARRPKSAPEPTTIHLDFIRASEEEAEARSSAQRKQLEAMAAAQAEREKAQAERETALHEAQEALKQAADAQRKWARISQAQRDTALHKAHEALKQAADAQRKRARIRNIAFVVVSIFAVLAGLLGLLSQQQRKVAEEQREVAEAERGQADRILARATNIIGELQTDLNSNTKKEVFALFQAGAEHGDAISMRNLAISYHNGFGVAQDEAKAREWYEKSAHKGEARAMALLGTFYENGQGVPQDYAKARDWYERAADKGDAFATTNLGRLYAIGLGGAEDYAKARELYEKAADKGDAVAMFNLGALYHKTQDYAKAREWFEKAADKGDARAMTNLGKLYANGDGVTQDYAKAREWFEKAADNGRASATNLGALYANGDGVTQDYAKAREWSEKAADNGRASAMTNLGKLYANGDGVTQDYAKARELYEKAADKGDAVAMFNLGALYANGDGVTQDDAKAREWFKKAADKGDASAKANLEQLSIREAFGAGRYAEALQLQEALAAKVEAAEIKRDGQYGKDTAQALNEVTWYALFARDFTKALAVAERAHAFIPDDHWFEISRAHALMFLERGEESKALYLAHKGKLISEQDGQRLWERVIAEDFAEFRKVGLTHPMMAEIEKELGVSP